MLREEDSRRRWKETDTLLPPAQRLSLSRSLSAGGRRGLDGARHAYGYFFAFFHAWALSPTHAMELFYLLFIQLFNGFARLLFAYLLICLFSYFFLYQTPTPPSPWLLQVAAEFLSAAKTGKKIGRQECILLICTSISTRNNSECECGLRRTVTLTD